jgi:tetratricopeptide (TPR) repeat protein
MLVLIIIITLFLIAGFLYIFKRVTEDIRLRYDAKLNIGSRVSLREDKGARLAYEGICDCFKHKYEKAVVCFEEAIRHSYDPHNCAFCLEWMTKCYDAQGMSDESFNCCVKAVQVAPSSSTALSNLADRYVKKGWYDKAEFYYKSVLKFDEKNDYAIYLHGMIEMGRGHYEEAVNWFEKPTKTEEYPPLIAEHAMVSAITGNYDKAEIFYEKAKNKGYEEIKRLREKLDCIKRVRELCLG